jgi:hypothetical protein
MALQDELHLSCDRVQLNFCVALDNGVIGRFLESSLVYVTER